MSNIVPQNSGNNSGVWGQFKNYCRDLTVTNELLIICGPSGFSGARINTNGYVWIPQFTWKIVVVVPPGAGMATNRITTTNRVIAIKVPNTDAVTNSWPTCVTSANQIQVDTGFNFFTALPPSVAAVLRSKVDGQTNAIENTVEQSASYLQGWMTAIKDDEKLLVHAAAAQKASDYILNRMPVEAPAPALV